MTSLTRVISFGYGHGAPPEATIVVDVRHRLRDPRILPELREMTGADPAVQAKVQGTPGARQLVYSLAHFANAMEVDGQPLVIAIGCVGGRHRSYVLAEWVAAILDHHGATVEHRDVHKDVIRR